MLCYETTRFPKTSFLTHFGVSVAMDDHWQRVVNGVSNSYAVCSKLEKHFICQKREQETFRQGYENRLTTWSGAVNVYKGGLPGPARCLKIYMFLVVWEQYNGFQLVKQVFTNAEVWSFNTEEQQEFVSVISYPQPHSGSGKSGTCDLKSC